MSGIIKPVANEAALSTANAFSNATLIRVSNPTTGAIVLQVNSGGAQIANLTILANSEVTVCKPATATLSGSGLVAVPVAYKN